MNEQQYNMVSEEVHYEKGKKNGGIKNTVKGLLFLLKPTWKYGKFFIISSVLLSAIQPLTTVITVMFQKKVIDDISDQKSLEDIIKVIVFFALLIILFLVINNIWSDLYREKKQAQINAAINKEIYIKTLATDFSFFDDPEFFNNYTWTISQYSAQSEVAYNILLSFVSALSGIVALTAVIIESDALILLLTIATLVASSRLKLIISRVEYQKINERVEPERKKDYVHRTMYQKEYIAGLKSTKVSEMLIQKYNIAVDSSISIIKHYSKKKCIFNNLQDIISNLLYFTIVGYLGFRIVNGDLTIGSFTAMITASTVLKTYLGNFVDILNKSQQSVMFSEKICGFFKLRSTIENKPDEGEDVPDGPMEIELKNVDFSYPHSEFALKNVNMKIKKGSKIAIVGENGTGKTTLTKLLLRLYDPLSGDILINGTSLKDYKVKELRSKVGIAFQDAPLYALSIAENMSVYNKTDDEKINNIFEIIGLDKVMKKSNSNLENEITREFDKNGLVLSGGEKQKFLLARLFTKDFGLLILDEPTSALDPLAEYELNKIIFNKASTTTTIMVSHRLSAVRDADCIYLFNNGCISEFGTHNELMQLHGKYYEMFTKQAENYIDRSEKA